MNTLLLCATLLCWQESTANAVTAPAVAPRMLDLKVQMIGLKDTLEVPEGVVDPEAFLKNPETQKSLIWRREFQTSTIVDREVMMSVGETTPVISGITVAAQGQRIPNLTMQHSGGMIRLKGKIDSNERIMLNVKLENSRIDRGEHPGLDPQDPNGLQAEMLNSAIRQMVFESELALVDGKTKMISHSQSSVGKNSHSENVVILITARALHD
ncbi:MAG TPA: hypothetical protein PK992_14855 [Planctomycetaceae bacterium]|nr:hypothetical protein [Planctomycetaceae bacterium]HRA89362.1 hypothetical protein [Planctomycetaceae bacterium]